MPCALRYALARLILESSLPVSIVKQGRLQAGFRQGLYLMDEAMKKEVQAWREAVATTTKGAELIGSGVLRKRLKRPNADTGAKKPRVDDPVLHHVKGWFKVKKEA